MRQLKRVRWIHGELLYMPPKGSYPGGRDYHQMVSYFLYKNLIIIIVIWGHFFHHQM
jgi:hypothetical protein